MRVLTVTYPLMPLSATVCGGTEQIARQVVRGLGGVAGTVIETIAPERHTPRVALEKRSNRRVLAYLRQRPVFDLVHNQGGFIYQEAHAVKAPVLMTLHLARSLYPAPWPPPPEPNLFFQCVSKTQFDAYARDPAFAPSLAGWIANGIELDQFPARSLAPGAHAPLLYLGRICPEKAPHLAIAVAHITHRRLWIVGEVYPFAAHQQYFRREIQPHLDGHQVQWMPPPPLLEKIRLLRSAAAVLIPSQVEETSSLVAMEAAACGTPVIAMRRGALAEVIVEGETGWLADSVAAMAAATEKVAALSPAACRLHAEAHFCGRRMVGQYLDLYRSLTAGSTGQRRQAA